MQPASLAARSIGFYSRGCLAGAQALPVNGETWQVMRISRDRIWGHPNLVKFLERLSSRAPEEADWPGILVGDMSQPRGGPMITGHASHQIGLDADIWLTPMPDRTLSRREREEMSATNMVRRMASTLIVRSGRRALGHHPGGGARSRRRAHFRQCGDQEGALPRCDRRSLLAEQGAPLLRA